MTDTGAPPSEHTSLAARYVPILGSLPSSRREWLMLDSVAALSVWALLVPQGLAHATLAGAPVQ